MPLQSLHSSPAALPAHFDLNFVDCGSGNPENESFFDIPPFVELWQRFFQRFLEFPGFVVSIRLFKGIDD